MSEKELENELNGEELETGFEANENDSSSEWQFDAEVPTLDDSLELAGGYEINIPEKKTEQFNPGGNNDDVATIRVKKKPVKIVLCVLLAAVIAAALVFLGVRYYTVPNSDEKMNPGNIALTISETDISVGMYDYYYASIVYEAEQYSSYGYNNLDTSKDYSQQFTEDKNGNQITWLEKFKQDTIDRLKTVTIYYEKAQAAGITLTEEQMKTIDEQISGLETNAGDSGESVNEYISKIYGDYCGVATLRSYLEMYLLAGSYFNQMNIDEKPSDDEAEAYFNENQENYMACSYAMIEVPYNVENDGTKAESLEKIKGYAAQITDVETMKAVLPEASKELIDQYVSYGYFENADAAVETLLKSIELSDSKTAVASNFGSEIADWMFSADTAVGSTNYYISEDNGAAAIILKTGTPELDETEVYSVRHILITPESEGTQDSNDASQQTEYTDDEWLEAQNKADAILAEYNNGDKTEKSFAKLAEENSQDTESTSKGSSGMYGGGYEGVSLGQMVPEFESWATDKSRKAGDVGIVKSDYGYHVMYFIYDGPVCRLNAKSDLINENLQKEFDDTEVKERRSMNKTKTAKPSASASANNAQ